MFTVRIVFYANENFLEPLFPEKQILGAPSRMPVHRRTVSHDVRVSIPDVGRFRPCNRLRRRFPRRFRPRRRLYRVRDGRRTTNDRLLSFERTNVQVVVGPDALGQVFAVGRSRAHVFRFRVAAAFSAHVACKKLHGENRVIRRTAEAFLFFTENPYALVSVGLFARSSSQSKPPPLPPPTTPREFVTFSSLECSGV